METEKAEPKKKKVPVKTFHARDKGGVEYTCKAVDASEAGFLFSQAFKKKGMNFFVDVRDFGEAT